MNLIRKPVPDTCNHFCPGYQRFSKECLPDMLQIPQYIRQW